jgi:hypothetical protein
LLFRWLLAQGCRDEAIKILSKTHQPSEEEIVMLTVSEIEAQIGTNIVLLLSLFFYQKNVHNLSANCCVHVIDQLLMLTLQSKAGSLFFPQLPVCVACYWPALDWVLASNSTGPRHSFTSRQHCWKMLVLKRKVKRLVLL